MAVGAEVNGKLVHSPAAEVLPHSVARRDVLEASD